MWMSRARFELSEEVPGTPDDVRTFYTDLANTKLVHPLVVAVEVMGIGTIRRAITVTIGCATASPLAR